MALQVVQKQQVLKQYQRSGKDTGSPEVQIALLTERINGLTEHFKTHVKDFHRAPRAAQAGEPAPQAARLPQAQGRGQVPRPHRAAEPAQIGLGRRQRASSPDERFLLRDPREPHQEELFLRAHQVTFETGEIARQAHGSVVCSMDDTVVLATVVAAKEPRRPGLVPLTVDYVEKTYAAGKIPGGFFKREAGLGEGDADLAAHRPADPAALPDGFLNEVQVVATVLSLNPEIDSDIPAMLAVSAALEMSGIPFNGRSARAASAMSAAST